MNLANDLERAAHRHAGKPAVVQAGRVLTFDELDAEASRLAGALASLGVGPGDRVACVLPSTPEHVITFYAVLKLGAIHVGVNLGLSTEEMSRQLADADVRCIVTDRSLADRSLECSSPVAGLAAVAVLGHDAPEGANALASLMAEQPPLRPARLVASESPAVIFYTSGTTGVPKGVVHTHEALSVLIDATGRRHRLSHEDSTICLLPLFMLSILLLGPGVAVRNGNTLHLLDRYDAVRWARTVTEHRVSYALGTIPTLYIDLAALPPAEMAGIDLSSLRFATFGGAPIPIDLRREFEDRYGFTLTFGFGGTEGPAGVASEPEDPGQRKDGSVGFPYDHVDLRIVDRDDVEVPPGVVGEITTGPYASGPFAGMYRPMKEYWGMPEATAHALRGGRLHWGDLGVIDEDGHLFIVDRLKDMIIRAGMNIYPAEVERILCRDERVEQAAVVGVAAGDARLGEVPVAFVKLHSGVDVHPEELRVALNERLSRYQRLDELQIVEEFPRNSLGKILKHDLRADLARTPASNTGPRAQSPT